MKGRLLGYSNDGVIVLDRDGLDKVGLGTLGLSSGTTCYYSTRAASEVEY
jgi:hypothetical protein